MSQVEDTTLRTEHATKLEPEVPALRTFHRDVEKVFIDKFAEAHQGEVALERIDHARTHEASLERRKEFEAAFQSRYGQPPEAAVTGFYDEAERRPHVRTEGNDDVAGTIAHEHAHGFIAPEARRDLPPSVIEGITENYARKFTGFKPEAGDMAAYENEVRAIQTVEQKCGSEVVDRAYLKGETAAFRHAVDDTFARMQQERTAAEKAT